MPRASRWWGTPGGQACPRRIDRFLEPCLLLLLRSEVGHGYELLEELKQFGFHQNPVDSSTVYRTLRNLVERRLVASIWDTSGTGPARRLYRLTEQGAILLDRWVIDLRETDRVLHRFLKRYDEGTASGA
jgi:PadR family transcriptional regulator PadR